MKITATSPPNLPSGQFETLNIEELNLDRKNPRLVEYGIQASTHDDEVLKILWDEMDVEEVAMSIAKSGFWGHEPLIVTTEGQKNIVIEGNRRLAAAKILTNPSVMKKLRATALPSFSGKSAAAHGLVKLPVIRVAKREDAWPFIGFKHVNGPQKWRSYAKAQYIASVRKSTGTSLGEIASRIGDRHGTVQELYRALMVIEQAEAANVYKRDFVKGRLAFSHLTTALQYPNFSHFLGIKDASDESEKPVPTSKLADLGKICTWLWGDRRSDTDRVIVSQNPNLRELEQVLGNKAARTALESGHGLSVAFDESKGDDSVFIDALHDAKNALVKAQGRVSSGYRGETTFLDLARTISRMAEDLLAVMESKLANTKSRRGK
jgi:hypothetical protein